MDTIEKTFGANLPDYKELLEQNLSLRRVNATLTGMLSKREQELHDLVPALKEFQPIFETKIYAILRDCVIFSKTLSESENVDSSSLDDISWQLKDLVKQEKRFMANILESGIQPRNLIDSSLDQDRSRFADNHNDSSIQDDCSIYYETGDLNFSSILKADARTVDDESGFKASDVYLRIPMNSTSLEGNSPSKKPTRVFGKHAENQNLGPENDLFEKKIAERMEKLLNLMVELKSDINELKTTNTGLSGNVEEALAVGQKLLDRINTARPDKEESSKNNDDVVDPVSSSKRRPNPKIVIHAHGSEQKRDSNPRKPERTSSLKISANSTNTTEQPKARSKSTSSLASSCLCKLGCRTRSCKCWESRQSCEDCSCDADSCTNRSTDQVSPSACTVKQFISSKRNNKSH